MKASHRRRLSRGFLAGSASLLLLGASAQASQTPRVVNEGGIRDEWMLAEGAKLAAPGYPAAFAERGDNVCIAVGYLINPDGTTSDFALLKGWNSSSRGEKEPAPGFWESFAQAGAVALAQWQFKPRPEVSAPRPTYTVATMVFMGKRAEPAAGLRSHCTIADLAATKADLEGKASRRNDMNKHQLDKTMNDIFRTIPTARTQNPRGG